MPRRPNILLITADQLRADALGCYGNQHCQTPNLDALAGRGVVFENGFTPNPICVPARASITTGNYSHVCTDHKNNGGRIRDGQPKLAEHFGRGGYRTYACGKLHYVPYAPPGVPRLLHGFHECDLNESGRVVAKFAPFTADRGIEDYIDYLADVGWGGYSCAHGVGNNDIRPCPTPLPPEHHMDHWVADRTIARLRAHAAERAGTPFLLWCSFSKPHAPLDPPAEFVKLYDPRKLPRPAGDESLIGDRDPFLTAERVTRAQDSLSPAAKQVIKAYYYALITHQDQQIGRVMAALAELGQLDNTVVIYTADHGDLMGDFGTFFKANMLNGSVRVPFLWAGPGVPAGQRRPHLAGLQDIMPTLAALADCPLDQTVQGMDLSGVFADAGAPGREAYYSQCGDAPSQKAMLCDQRWKYIYCQQGPTEELYDQVNDPRELVNLAARPEAQELLATWRQRLIDEVRRLGDLTLLDPAGRLVTAPVDRAALAKLPVQGMGWRWF